MDVRRRLTRGGARPPADCSDRDCSSPDKRSRRHRRRVRGLRGIPAPVTSTTGSWFSASSARISRREIETVHARHLHIGHDDVEALRAQRREGVDCRRRPVCTAYPADSRIPFSSMRDVMESSATSTRRCDGARQSAVDGVGGSDDATGVSRGLQQVGYVQDGRDFAGAQHRRARDVAHARERLRSGVSPALRARPDHGVYGERQAPIIRVPGAAPVSALGADGGSYRRPCLSELQNLGQVDQRDRALFERAASCGPRPCERRCGRKRTNSLDLRRRHDESPTGALDEHTA